MRGEKVRQEMARELLGVEVGPQTSFVERSERPKRVGPGRCRSHRGSGGQRSLASSKQSARQRPEAVYGLTPPRCYLQEGTRRSGATG